MILRQALEQARKGQPKPITFKGWIKMNIRQNLIDIYLDFVNNFLTVDFFAEHYGLTYNQAFKLLEVARSVLESNHPEA